jgi:hypothetical protein
MNCRPKLQSSSSSHRLHQLLHISGGAPNIDGKLTHIFFFKTNIFD